jgi:hypothetical protein
VNNANLYQEETFSFLNFQIIYAAFRLISVTPVQRFISGNVYIPRLILFSRKEIASNTAKNVEKDNKKTMNPIFDRYGITWNAF